MLRKKSRELKICHIQLPQLFVKSPMQFSTWNIRGVPQMFHVELLKTKRRKRTSKQHLGGILMLKARYQKENYLSRLKIIKKSPSVTKNETKLNAGVGVELIATLGHS